jgi:hypothetical protein
MPATLPEREHHSRATRFPAIRENFPENPGILQIARPAGLL